MCAECTAAAEDVACLDDQVVLIGGRSVWYDKDGKPIGMRTLARYYADPGYAFRGRTYHAQYEVCTDWAGIDWNALVEDVAPWETMIAEWSSEWDGLLRTRTRDFLGFRWRYATEAEARAGHWLVSTLVLAMALFERGLPAAPSRSGCNPWRRAAG